MFFGSTIVARFFSHLHRLCFEQHQGDLMVTEVLRYLDEKYLLSLPLPKGVRWPEEPAARNFRFMFRRQVAQLLGSTERRVESEANGFSFSINKGLRFCWWPDEEPRIEYGKLSPIPERHPRSCLCRCNHRCLGPRERAGAQIDDVLSCIRHLKCRQVTS
ncbi:hypothetical protein KC19_9G014000 [Ceratodon purpureus]|uniref:Uncharacterized protein n=1 Tax=Ceratodon purpureus TaxID=3225 RepID=A0A8T0GQS4_CERPU|nr:hypothetical protein KC19_9G014000 [Ceratodon purpureus]